MQFLTNINCYIYIINHNNYPLCPSIANIHDYHDLPSLHQPPRLVYGMKNFLNDDQLPTHLKGDEVQPITVSAKSNLLKFANVVAISQPAGERFFGDNQTLRTNICWIAARLISLDVTISDFLHCPP